MQPVALGQHRVDERLADVDPAAAGLEHPLDQLLHLRGREHQVGQLVTAVAGDEDPARVVDPDLLDGRVVEERLQRPEPGHPRDQLADHGVDVGDRRDRAGQAALVVLADHALGDPAYDDRVALRVDALAAHQRAHALVERLDQLHAGIGQRHQAPVPSQGFLGGNLRQSRPTRESPISNLWTTTTPGPLPSQQALLPHVEWSGPVPAIGVSNPSSARPHRALWSRASSSGAGCATREGAMTFVQPTKVTELTQELRLATTMTGGVSLAIWMGGVAREINLLSQASQWRRTGGEFPAGTSLSTPATESLKLYAGLIDLLDLVVDVDVLSGTSAGGINAALLASARATGIDLGGFRDLWMDLGALTDLLRNPADKTTPSLLYGDERMFAALEENLPKLAIGPFPPVRHEDPAWTPPTTLYVTTTLLTGEVGRFTDSFGTVVQDVDRRGLFTFTRSQLAEREGIAPALALAARSSASFPGAFEPSFIPFNRGTAKTKTIPARPGMAAYANTTRPHWVADGGLLDNRPIGVLLQSIFDRPARRPVRRVLLFVVPSSGPAPDLLEQAPPDDVSDPLGLVDGLLQDLAAVTTQSIAADLKAIRAHQDRLEARTDTRLRLAELAPALRDGSRLLTVPLLEDYRTRQATKEARDLTAGLLKQLSTWPDDAPSSNSLAYIPSNVAAGPTARRRHRGSLPIADHPGDSRTVGPAVVGAPRDLGRPGEVRPGSPHLRQGRRPRGRPRRLPAGDDRCRDGGAGEADPGDPRSQAACSAGRRA